MALGPVLRYELLTTSRRPRNYWTRLLYGCLLLIFLYQQNLSYEMNLNVYGLSQTQTSLRFLAEQVFASIAGTQLMALMFFTPAMVAGVIADEARRKTLHDLLASGLSSTSIVLGKLSARLVHALVLIAVGVPIMALVELLGGLDPTLVAYVYVGTLTTVFAVGGMSILVSVLARSPREAILASYALLIGWLIGPALFGPLFRHMIWPLNYLDIVNQGAEISSPTWISSRLTMLAAQRQWEQEQARLGIRGFGGFVVGNVETDFQWLIGIQAGIGLLTVILAILLLRPVRGFGDGTGALSWKRFFGKRVNARIENSRVLIAPKPCGDIPMFWKERRVALRGGLAWLASRPAALVLGTLLGCYLFEASRPAFGEVINMIQGLNASDSARNQLHEMIQNTAVGTFSLWVLVVACAGSVSITEEKESDTWISLTATLLGGNEIIWGKVFGSLWAARWIGLAMLAMIVVGLLAGALHPLGAFLAVLGMAVYGTFAAAMGIAISLWARNSTRALLFTVVVLVVINMGILMALSFFGREVNRESPAALVGVAPFVEWLTFLSYGEFDGLWRGTSIKMFMNAWQLAAMIAGSFTLYGVAALGLITRSIRMFDQAVDRPRRIS